MSESVNSSMQVNGPAIKRVRARAAGSGRSYLASFSPVESVRAMSPARPVLSTAKRVLDVIAVLLLSPIALVLGALIALVVKLSSSGPVFFRQERLGLLARPFVVWKFRTMRFGASQSVHREFVSRMISESDYEVSTSGTYKLVDDARVTIVGAWLRRFSLDELPQLLNVLRGDMSLVGPRPPLEYEVALYDEWQFERLSVRPGITGLWQVSGRNRMSYAEMCRLDVRYVREWSLLRDALIVLRTPWVMFTNSGKAA